MNTSASAEARTAVSPWSAVIAVAIGAFALVTSEFLPVGLLPQIARDLDVTDGQAGLMVTLPGIVAAFAALLTSTAFGRIDRRHVLMSLLGVLVLSNALVAVSTQVAVLLAGRALIGAAIGSFWAIGVSMGPRLRPGADGIKAASIILSGVSIGTVAGVPAGAMLGHLLGWRWSFACAAGMALLVLGALAIWLPPVKPDAGRGIKQLAALMNVRPLRAALIATLTMFVGQFGTYTYIAPFLNQVAHVDGKAISAVLLGYGVASFFGNLLGGWACAKNIRLAVVATGLVTGCALLCLAVVGTQPFWAIACVLLWGVGFGMLPISFQSWVFDASPESMDNTGSLFVATAQVAIATGSLMGGASVDHLGLVATMLSGGALSVITGMVLVRTMLFRRGARLPLASLRSER